MTRLETLLLHLSNGLVAGTGIAYAVMSYLMRPTDEWAAAVEELSAKSSPRMANIYAIGCGPDADTEILRRVTDIVLIMKE